MSHGHEAAHGHHEAPPEPKELRIGYDSEDHTLIVNDPDGNMAQFFPETDQDAFYMTHALQQPESLQHPNLPKGMAAMKARLLELGWNFDDPFSQAVAPGSSRPTEHHQEHDDHSSHNTHHDNTHAHEPVAQAAEDLDDTEEQQRTRRTAKQLMNKVGRAVFVGSKIALKGTRHTGHVVGHAVADTATKAFDVTKDAVGNAVESIKTRASSVLDDAKQLLVDYKVDAQMTAADIKATAVDVKNGAKTILDPKNEHEALHEAIEILFQPLGDDERDAALQQRRQNRYTRWTEKDSSDKERAERKEIARWARARLKALALKSKRLRLASKQAEQDEKLRKKLRDQYIKGRALNVVRLEDNEKVNRVIKGTRRYLADRHAADDTSTADEKAKEDYYKRLTDTSGWTE